MNKQNRDRWPAIIVVFFGAASYGMLSPFIKLAYDDGFNEAQITASQIGLGTVLLWLIVAVRRNTWSNPFRGPWIRLSIIGIIGLALTTVFYNTSLSYLNASMAIVLLFQFTWITVFLESILLRRWPNRNQLTAIAVIMAGTLLAVGLSWDAVKQLSGYGILFGLLSGLTYSVFLTMTGRVETSMDTVLKSAVMQTAALPVIFLIYPPHMWLDGGHASLLAAWGLWLGLLGQVFPTIFFNIGIPRIGGSLAAMVGSTELPVAIIGAFFILHEPIGWQQWAGMALILAGIIIAEKKQKAAV